ncbi:MAG: MliC family protein [Paracoccaceae bacterium]
MMRIGLTVSAVLFPVAALAAPEFTTARYNCDRGVSVPATYVTSADGGLVVLHVESAQITLVSEVVASGARYGWPSDGANYVWLTKGDTATLYWKEAGEETPLLTCTTAQ